MMGWGSTVWLTLVLSSAIPTVHASEFLSAISSCPQQCSISGPSPSNWTVYHEVEQLFRCNETVLFDFNIHNSLDQAGTLLFRACSTAGNTNTGGKRDLPAPIQQRQFLSLNKTDANLGKPASDTKCGKTNKKNVSVLLTQSGQSVANAASSALHELQKHIGNGAACGEQVMFAMAGKAIVGMYKGSLVDGSSVANLITKFAEQGNGLAERSALQICSGFGPSMLGVVADMSGNLARVQKSIAMVSNATCLTGDKTVTWNNTEISVLSATEIDITPNGDHPTKQQRSLQLQGRDTCKYTQVKSGDGCWALADRCGIPQEDITKYNTQPNFCNTLLIDQYVCCGAGTLPDFSPQPNKDGSCFSYNVAAGDTCAAIATAHTMKVDRIDTVNKKTWGWAGCNRLLVGQTICLSDGTPPLPAPVANAVCGPQVPGTVAKAGTNVADLNPCPLNSCCNVWGQCGITPDFCTVSPSDTGAPGTSSPGVNSCISNCGTDIPNVGGGPKRVRQLGYFEAFAKDRKCMNMDISKIPMAYTDIHYSFAGITKDFQVDVSQYPDVWAGFKKITQQRKIVSFGGWSFSTDTDTFPIFRKGVSDQERQAFAKTIADFVVNEQLDGVDFDWEYPAAPDIPNIPAGDKDDGLRYLQFLKLVRAALPTGRSLSIAAPASYWYLKGFPIKDISAVVDYIVYMTYDLHGQWDYGNTFVNQGCPNGNCLRNHINMTETNYSLAMITKAGVPRNKVLVGLGSYGRSFKMTTPGCTGPSCTFTGPASGATPGQCTGEAGYISNFEIQSLIENSKNGGKPVQVIKNPEGDVAIIDNTDWVGFMMPDTFAARMAMFQKDNWGGTVEWAIDLNADSYSGTTIDDSDDDPDVDPLCDWSRTLSSLDQVANGNYPALCGTVHALDVLSRDLDAVNTEYNDANNGYDALYGYYVKYMTKMIQPSLDSFMDNGGRKYFDCAELSYHNNATSSCDDVLASIKFSNIFSLHYILRDKAGFFNDLLSNHGILADWVKFDGVIEHHNSCGPKAGDCEPQNQHTYGFPQTSNNPAIPNPKDIISKAGPNMSDLKATIDAMWLDVMTGQWAGALEDILPVAAIPVSLIKDAISNMHDVKRIGETEKEEEKKELIFKILTIVFSVVPFVGEAGAAAAGLAQLGRIIAILGELGNAALSIYGVVSDPSSAPMALFGILMGATSVVRTEENFGKMGGLARKMDAEGILTKLGRAITEDGTKVKKIIKACVK